MNKWLLLFLVSLVGLGYWLSSSYLNPNVSAEVLMAPETCRFGVDDCHVVLPGGADITIKVEGSVRPLSTFNLIVDAPEVKSLAVSFEMIDMDMGINRYRFSDANEQRFVTPVMLPVCTTGRVDWVAHFDIRLLSGKTYRLEYPFTAEGLTAPS